MRDLRTIVKNIASLTVLRIITIGLELFFVVSVARSLGDAALGQYSFGLAFSLILCAAISPGFQLFIIKEVARDKKLANRYLGNLLIIETLLFFVIFSAIVIIINVVDCLPDTKAIVYIFGLYTLTRAFGFLTRGVFHAFEKMEYSALLTISEKIIIVSMGLVSLSLGCDIAEILYCYLVGGVFNVILSYIVTLRKFGKPDFAVDLNLWRRLPKEVLPLSLNSVFINMFDKIDTLMIMVMVGNSANGYYNAAFTIVNGLQIIPLVLNGALLPAFSRLYTSSVNSLERLYKSSFKYLFIITLPMTVGVTLLSEELILLIYGNEFIEASLVLELLTWMFMFNSFNWLLVTVLQATDRHIVFALSVGILAVLNVILDLLFIPWLGYEGAGLTTLVVAFLLFLVLYRWVSKYLHEVALAEIAAKPIVAGLLMGLAIHYMLGPLHLLYVIMICIVVYFAALLALRGLSLEDMRSFKRLMTNE